MAKGYTNPWGIGSPINDQPSARDRGSSNGTGRKAAQGKPDSNGNGYSRRMALDVDFIGPDIDAVGMLGMHGGDDDFMKIPGDKAQPAALMPPDIKLSPDQEKALIRYLERELNLCESERLPYLKKLARLKFKYRTEFPDQPKNWPIANSSQITIPIIKTAVDTINARLFQTLVAADPLVRVKTDDEQFVDDAFAYEKFLKTYGEQKLDLEGLLEPWATEVTMLGTGVLETTNWREQKSLGSWDVATSKFVKKTVVCHNGPQVFHFPIEDFWCRVSYQDPDKAPWCGKELRPSWSQVKSMAFSGMLNPDKINAISKYTDTSDNSSLVAQVDQRIENSKPTNDSSKYTIHELCVRWDVDGDGLEEELIIYFHRSSRTILRIKFNEFYGGSRPWTITQFKKIPHRLYGEGIAETLEHLQEEISTIHNQRIDNATIANLRIILVAKALQGLKPGDRLWSGKIVKVTDVARDVGTLQLGEVYPSTVNNENIAQSYVREVSGASEAAMGQAQPVSRTTATAQMALLEELNRRFDKPLRNMRRALRDVHGKLTDLFLEQGTGGLAEDWLGSEQGRRLEAFLALPPEMINKKVKLSITATKSSNNREVDFQTQIAVMQLVIQNGQQLLSMVQNLAPQATAVVAHELVQTIRPIFHKVMQYAEAGDPDAAVAVLDVVERILPAPEDMGGMGMAQLRSMQAAANGGTPGNVPGQPGGPTGPQVPSGNRGVVQTPGLPQSPAGTGAVPTPTGGY